MRHQLEHKGTRFFQSTTSVLLFALATGCASPGKVSVEPTQGAGANEKLDEIGFSTRLDPEQDFALLYGEDRLMFLGVSKEEALEVFEPLKKSIEFSSLPQQFDERRFSAFGWETDSFAFGCLTYSQTVSGRKAEQVVLAMYTQEGIEDDVVRATVDQYTERYGEPEDVWPGNRIAYWFWNKPGRRLMVNSTIDSKGKKALTVAVGETQVMTLLGMEAAQAKKDKDTAIQRLNEAETP